MCPKPNVTIHELSRKSHVEELDSNTPTLFVALTDQEDVQNRWSIVTFPVDIDTTAFQPAGTGAGQVVTVVASSAGDSVPAPPRQDPNQITVNCTVAYMGQCMSWNKCKASCTSMGASSYRSVLYLLYYNKASNWQIVAHI